MMIKSKEAASIKLIAKEVDNSLEYKKVLKNQIRTFKQNGKQHIHNC
jgi:hypothetical protein